MQRKRIFSHLAIAGGLIAALPMMASSAAEPPSLPTVLESIPEAAREMFSRAKTALAKGDAAAAAEWFEQAAARGEFAEAEIGEVRARLLAGEFRHTLTIANAVAVEHPESPAALALLAYTNDRSGYTAEALEFLQDAQRSHPDAVALIAAEAEILIDRHAAARAIDLLDRWQQQHGLQADLCRLRARAALVSNDVSGYRQWRAAVPAATSPNLATDWPPAVAPEFPFDTSTAATYGNGIVLDHGKHVLTLRRLVPPSANAIWVRNARGELRRARLETDASHSPELTLLSLETPFADAHSLAMDGMAPLTGRGLCFALGFPASRSADSMQPATTPCVLIDSNAAAETQRINVSLAAGDDGSPVFDTSRHLLGLADSAGTPTSGTSARPMTGTIVWHQATNAGTSASHPVPFAETYERLASTVVQIVTIAPPPK